MSISDRHLVEPEVGMQEIIRMFNKEYSKTIGFTINSDYSQNEIYQTYALMCNIIMKFGIKNYTLNGYLNALKYYLLIYTRPCRDINEYDAYRMVIMSDDLHDGAPA